MTDFKFNDRVVVTQRPPALTDSYIGKVGVITQVLGNDPSWDYRITTEAKDYFYVKASGIKLVDESPVKYRYEVKSNNFTRNYDDEGKAIAVARALRDAFAAVDYTVLSQAVTLTKTPTSIVPEKVNF
jgi:hypothetical protein